MGDEPPLISSSSAPTPTLDQSTTNTTNGEGNTTTTSTSEAPIASIRAEGGVRSEQDTVQESTLAPVEPAAAGAAAAEGAETGGARGELAGHANPLNGGGEQSQRGDDTVQKSKGSVPEGAAATAIEVQLDKTASPPLDASLPSASASTSTSAPAAPTPTGSNLMVQPTPDRPTSPASLAPPTAPPSAHPPTIPSAPSPSVSPAPTKKFQSSLSVNKKFLEKASSDNKSKEQPKVTVARLATPPIPTPISASHPRLLTGKISSTSASGPSLSLTSATSASSTSSSTGGASGAPSAAPVGWSKAAPIVDGGAGGAHHHPPTSQQLGFGGPPSLGGGGGLFERGGPRGPASMGHRGPGGSWGAGGRAGSRGDYGPGGEFPTAAEAANAKNLRAQAILEQMQSRDRAVQARAAAAAAANAHLLEGLDAFRGVHLDPNASHWDEDVDDDFLDDTIEFGDGTQYKISEDVAPPPSSAARAAGDELREPHPSDLATREAPLAPGETVEPVSREERFKDDYDRSYKKPASASTSTSATSSAHHHHPPAASDSHKNLFNERLGKFEPYAGRSSISEVVSSSSSSHHRRSGSSEAPPHHGPPSARRPSITSPRLDHKPPLPPPNAWGAPRGPALGGRRPSIEHHAMPSVGARRPSNEHGGRRPSMEAGARRPSIGAHDAGLAGGRQLPPHLAAQQQAATRPSAPPAGRHPSVLSPPRATTALPPIAGSPAPAAPPASTAPPPSDVAGAEAVKSPTPEDLEALHMREMHAAAERAKKRRQEEEQARMEQAERAKKKAQELEERLKKAEEAKKPAAGAVNGVAPPPASTTTATPQAPAAERLESWRKPLPKTVVAPPPGAVPSPYVASVPAASSTATSAPPPPPPTVVKPEPTRILAREPQPPRPTASATPAAAPKAPLTSTRPIAPPSTAPVVPPTAPRAPLEPQERAWRRADAPIAGAVPPHLAPRPTPTSATSNNRQLPPHLAAAGAGAGAQQPATRAEPPHLAAGVSASAGRPADSYVRPAPPPAVVEPTPAPAPAPASAAEPTVAPSTPQPTEPASLAKEPPSASPSAVTAPPSPQTTRKAGGSTTPAPQKGAYKVPEVSQFEDLMSRIKGAMNAPAPPKTPTSRGAADNAETVSTSHSSPSGALPTVKLPAASSSAVAPTTSNVPTPAPSPPILTSKPPVPTEPRATKSSLAGVNGAQQQQQPRGRNGEPRKVSTRTGPSLPTFESREPLPLFERSRAARSPSPSPAWKLYPVRLGASSSSASPTPRRVPDIRTIQAFNNPRTPSKVEILSWNPPILNLIPRRLSRDDLLHPKRFFKGVMQCPVVLPKRKIVKKREIELSERKIRIAAAGPSRPKEEVKEKKEGGEEKKEGGEESATLPFAARGRGRGRAPESGPWRRESPLPSPLAESAPAIASTDASAKAAVEDASTPQPELNSTTAPPAEDLFKASPSAARDPKSKLPVGAGIAFYRSADGVSPSPLERSFMVTSELGGEVVNMGPRESLAAPGADLGGAATRDASTSPAFDSQNPVLSSPSSGWSSKPPLSLSVLDPTAPSVWSVPLSDAPVHSRSISLGAIKQENSLQGIADDDFPAAIPSSLADLKSEDEGSTEGKGEGAKHVVHKDEARLRAAAPSFSSFNPQAGAFDSSRPALGPRYPSFGRQSQTSPAPPLTYPSLTGGPPPPPPSFSPAPPHSLSGYSHAAPQPYPSFSIPSHSPSGLPSSYAQQQAMHQSYSPSPFSPHLGTSPSPQPVYNSYGRPLSMGGSGPPQGVTNPQLLANSYGYGAVGGGFGAVGAGGRATGGPGGYGRSPAPSPYGGPGVGGYREASGSFGSPQDVRAPLPFNSYGGGASSSGYGQPSPVMMPQHLPHHSPFLQNQQQPMPGYGGGSIGGAAQYSPQLQGAGMNGRVGAGAGAAQGYRRGQW
ncbi:hypothetical protein BCR35DRAFT_299305 [Leucosporidium creatinivorum]|uniref:Uncharacterized protein n=1 Tax=Leucosporidium creatinivorum TaxID=106004 RepID=A0A1Y2G1G7_9BASI|nr:hypothetical protein BCR35DRAFT_299305 [Leucosporidium creatinivorum]